MYAREKTEVTFLFDYRVRRKYFMIFKINYCRYFHNYFLYCKIVNFSAFICHLYFRIIMTHAVCYVCTLYAYNLHRVWNISQRKTSLSQQKIKVLKLHLNKIVWKEIEIGTLIPIFWRLLSFRGEFPTSLMTKGLFSFFPSLSVKSGPKILLSFSPLSRTIKRRR